MNHYLRTKIVATIGPALTKGVVTPAQISDPAFGHEVAAATANLENAFRNGVTVARLNFSHGTHDEHLARIKLVRAAAKAADMPVSIMLDTQGPEIRIGDVVPEGVVVEQGDTVYIYTQQKIVGQGKQFYASDSTGTYDMIDDLHEGSFVLVDDGKLSLTVQSFDYDKRIMVCRALNAHVVQQRKRINLPRAKYSIPFLSQRDRDDILFGVKHNVDYIAASFVNGPEDIRTIRELLKEAGAEHIKIIAKVESAHAIENVDDIIAAADGVMVARGDLSLEIPYYDVPHWERYMIKACRLTNRRVIVATQMLDSLEKNIQPTRAEVTDVYFAVDRGTDATMLSGETASGKYPLVAVRTMYMINRKSEEQFDYDRSINRYWPFTPDAKTEYGATVVSLARKVCPPRIVANVEFSHNFIVIFTNSDEEIYALSVIRPAAAIIVVTDDPKVYTGHGVDYGVCPYLVNDLAAAKKDAKKVAQSAILKHMKFGIISPRKPSMMLVNDEISEIQE